MPRIPTYNPSPPLAVDMGRIDPPQNAPNVREPRNVDIKNGKGEYLYAGPAGKIAVHPELSMFDGTLVISTLWSDNTTTTQTLSHPAGQPVDIGWDASKAAYFLRPASTAASSAAGAGMPASRPYRTHITIKDGAGTRLFAGCPECLYWWGTDVAPGTGIRSGGKLVITTEWSEGPPTTQELDYTGAQVKYDRWDAGNYYVDLDWNGSTKTYAIVPPKIVESEFSDGVLDTLKGFQLRAGYGEVKSKAITTGVNVVSQAPLQTGPDKVGIFSLDAGVPLLKWGEWASKLGLNVNWGQDSTHGDASAGTRGWAFQGGEHGGSGGSATNAPTAASVKTNYDEQALAFVASAPWGWFHQSERSKLTKEFQLTLDRIAQKYQSGVQTPITGLSSSESDKVTVYNLGVGGGASGLHRFDNGMTFSAGGRLSANYYWGDFKGTYHYTNPSAAPVNQDFTQTAGDSKNGFTWGGDAYVAFGVTPTRATEWSVRADYRYLGNNLGLQKKVVTSDPTPYLLDASLETWRVMLAVRHTF